MSPKRASKEAKTRLEKEGITLTLGGEPTYVPEDPRGAEWNFAAVGPTKLGYAKEVSRALLSGPCAGGVAFFCPGKLYPGETNPRWAIKVISSRTGGPVGSAPEIRRAKNACAESFADAVCARLGIPSRWVRLSDPAAPGNEVLAMPLDHDGRRWASAAWNLAKKDRELIPADGPAGLRLPLAKFPPKVPRRAITIEWKGAHRAIFFPPLLQASFLELLSAVQESAADAGIANLTFEGYIPSDDAGIWTVTGIAADPGVLEINLPACSSWDDYAFWMREVDSACKLAGLRPWKKFRGSHPEGSGGGNHILWGGPTLESNPFFTRPAWLARILRFFQAHPSLSYLFTGCYVGPSSQAPRPDESARDLDDLETAYRFLENLPSGDHRQLINETLRHLHTDVTGNAHRSEISFDKFWNPQWNGGALGLIEFRAIETLPAPDDSSAVALLLLCVAAACLHPFAKAPALKDFGQILHDRYFLPSPLLWDLGDVLEKLKSRGLEPPRQPYEKIWGWRFPEILRCGEFSVRRAHEGWPLLCETPVEGGATSRFVDTSMQRLELFAPEGFGASHEVYVAGRHVALKPVAGRGEIAGLKYRRTNLYPSLHPGIPPQVPLEICLLDKKRHKIRAAFSIASDEESFREIPASSARLGGAPARPCHRGAWTLDLRK